MRLFSSDAEVCGHGATYLRLISFMYLLPAITNGIQGYFRGIGDLKVTLISSFVNMGVRVIAAVILVFVFSLQIEALPDFLSGRAGSACSLRSCRCWSEATVIMTDEWHQPVCV